MPDISESTKAQAKEEIDAEVGNMFFRYGTTTELTLRENMLVSKLYEERARFLNVQDAIHRQTP